MKTKRNPHFTLNESIPCRLASRISTLLPPCLGCQLGFPVVLALLLLMQPFEAHAQWDYTTADGAITITGYSGPGGDVVIPSTIDGLPVTGIRDSALYGSINLSNVMIPNSVTNVGTGAFGFCTNLMSIAVDGANTHYSSVDGVLFDKTHDTLVQFPAGRGGSYAIPDSVLRIGDGVFVGCARLTSFEIPDSVTAIGKDAFYGCVGLTNVMIGRSVARIGDNAFLGCASLASVVISDSVTTIGDGAFSYSDSLASITIGNNVSVIGKHAFRYCIKLTSVVIPESVTTIGEWAFGNCWSLSDVAIPSAVTGIGDEAFADCKSLIMITVNAANSAYSSVGGVLFDKSQTKLIQYPAGKAGSYRISESVVSIGDSAFYGCARLSSIVIPNTVTRIGNYSFSYCTNLTSVTIPDGVTRIGASAFAACSGLSDVVIPETVTDIGTFAFRHCVGLRSVTIPDSVFYIGRYAFYSCSGLTNVTFGDSVVSIGKEAFNHCTSLTGIYFRGNAPRLGTFVFRNTGATIFFLAGTSGWGTEYGGISTAVWLPEIQFRDGVARVARVAGVAGNQFGFYIRWASGRVVVVEVTEDLGNPMWTPVSTNTLAGGSSYFNDAGWSNHPRGYYRLVSPVK